MAEEEILNLILDKISNVDKKVSNLDEKVGNLDKKVNSLGRRMDSLEEEVQKNRKMIENNTNRLDIVVKQVNENNQILKQENVQKWLKVGSEVMEHWKEK